MITERDKEILIWIEKYKSITINQTAKLFYASNKMAYDQARKRLRHLNKEGLVKRYRKDAKSETVYYIDKKLREHDIKIMDVVVELKQLNPNQVILQNKIVVAKSNLVSYTYVIDATVVINKIPILIEADYTHYTSNEKIKNLIDHLENKHKRGYIFVIVRQNVQKVIIQDLGIWSKLVLVDWKFNTADKLLRSLHSLLDL